MKKEIHNNYLRLMRIGILFIFMIAIFLSSCATLKMTQSKAIIRKSITDSPLLSQHFTGFALYDPETNEYLQEQNADKYFNPASNTKLFTFYAGLKMLEDSVPGLKYAISEDSLIFWGTGDPSFLHPDFESQKVFDFLKNSDKNLYYASGNFQDTHFGSGWAWDDYSYYFQTERSGMPIYGNQVSFVYDTITTEYVLKPEFFIDFSDVLDERRFSFYPNRNVKENIFSFYPDPERSLRKNRVPFKTSDELLVKLLADTLKKEVTPVPFLPRADGEVIYSRRMNELYAWMLKASDNFIAEQILYLCASQRGDTLNSARVRAFMSANHLNDLPAQAIWKDGSGLSRYNLFTPRSMVGLLEKIKDEIPEETLLNLLPKGGVDGTIKNWYKPDSEEPYIFAKTGTFSNNHSLSGFIRMASGKLLTFSFMNNNYNSSSAPVKLEMEKTLRLVRERY